MTTNQLTEAPIAPNLFAHLRALWLSACSSRQHRRDLEERRAALLHLDNRLRRDIGLGPKEHPLLSRADIILHLHP